jgi:hypothetical protein
LTHRRTTLSTQTCVIYREREIANRLAPRRRAVPAVPFALHSTLGGSRLAEGRHPWRVAWDGHRQRSRITSTTTDDDATTAPRPAPKMTAPSILLAAGSANRQHRATARTVTSPSRRGQARHHGIAQSPRGGGRQRANDGPRQRRAVVSRPPRHRARPIAPGDQTAVQETVCAEGSVVQR